jgi:hypothetical protein
VQKSYSRKSFAISDVLHATSADAIPGRQLSQNIVSKDDHGQSAQKSNKKEKVWVLERSGSIHPRMRLAPAWRETTESLVVIPTNRPTMAVTH